MTPSFHLAFASRPRRKSPTGELKRWPRIVAITPHWDSQMTLFSRLRRVVSLVLFVTSMLLWPAASHAQIPIALEDLTARAQSGDAKAQFSLGQAYLQGEGVPKDINLALEWYRKAADQNYADAENDLAALYAKGVGVTKDFAQALHWYRRAADHGSKTAQSALGSAYLYGYGVPKNAEASAKWYLMAARRGHTDSQHNLADMYRLGEGVGKDYIEAYKWWAIAAKGGNALSRGNRDRIATMLTPAQLEEGKKRVDAFNPLP